MERSSKPAPVGGSLKPAVQNNCCLRQHLYLQAATPCEDLEVGLLRKWDVDGRCLLGHSSQGGRRINGSNFEDEWSRMREQCRESTFSWLWERGRWRVVYRSRVTPAVLVISLAPNIFSLSQKYFFMCVKIFLASLRERRWRVVYRSRVTPAELVISLPPLLGEHQSWLSLCSRVGSYFLFEWEIFL